MQIVIVTGLSGAGKSTALRALEDIEFTCVDNIPVPLVAQMVDHLAHEERDEFPLLRQYVRAAHLHTMASELHDFQVMGVR